MVHSEALGILYVMRRYHAFSLSSEDVGSACDGETHFKDSFRSREASVPFLYSESHLRKSWLRNLLIVTFIDWRSQYFAHVRNGCLEPGPKSVSSILEAKMKFLQLQTLSWFCFPGPARGPGCSLYCTITALPSALSVSRAATSTGTHWLWSKAPFFVF